jgi:RNA polymerase sigma-70 factor (ECF subfamily)
MVSRPIVAKLTDEGAMSESQAPIVGEARVELAQWAPELLAVARYLCRSDSEAQDLVQTTLEIGLRKLHQLRDPANLRAWLISIETREGWRWRRRVQRIISLETTVRDLAAPDSSFERHVAIRDALRRLPSRTRTAVVLHHMSGLSVSETASAMNVSENTVKSQLRVGLARLREDLQ